MAGGHAKARGSTVLAFFTRGLLNTSYFWYFQYQVVGFSACPSEGAFRDDMTCTGVKP
jgi:hypothetical protein